MKLKNGLLKYCIAIIIFPFSYVMVHGQMVNEKYQTESIYLKGSKYVKNGVEHSIVSWNGELKKEMEISPNAVMEYAKFQQKRKTAFFVTVLGLVSIASSVIVDNNEGLQTGLLLGGFGLFVVSVPISAKANQSLQKAIWLRNGDILN